MVHVSHVKLVTQLTSHENYYAETYLDRYLHCQSNLSMFPVHWRKPSQCTISEKPTAFGKALVLSITFVCLESYIDIFRERGLSFAGLYHFH